MYVYAEFWERVCLLMVISNDVEIESLRLCVEMEVNINEDIVR